ncbi:hypothetical protein CTAYLR_004433 [Chrysophaeum taylorii]|uniref:Ribosomal silencing factor RsfS n=1 Tax=Chrysophaeum taylorii TaxID=2483200 RepID=A0AAD7XJR3_9STRA|nr:hypothetical protein CTAYLR_004433 [Chrysophaeum taylorii]
MASDGDWEFVPQKPTHQRPAPPRRRQEPTARKGSGLLSVADVVEILEFDGADDVRAVALKPEASLGDHMVFASARSGTHLSSLANALVSVLKERGLGDNSHADGRRDPDDWVAVDCGNMLVHLLMPDYRDELDLEGRFDATAARELNVVDDVDDDEEEEKTVVWWRRTTEYRKSDFRNYAAAKKKKPPPVLKSPVPGPSRDEEEGMLRRRRHGPHHRRRAAA